MKGEQKRNACTDGSHGYGVDAVFGCLFFPVFLLCES
jgi:hypothetical protein